MPEKKPELKSDALEAIKEKARLTYFDSDLKEVKSLKEILAKTKQIQDVYVPQLGCKVKIGHITMEEFSGMMSITDKNLLAIEMLFKLLHSGDSTVTKDDILALPFQITTAIIEQVMGGGMGFPTDST